MNKKIFTILSLLIFASMILAACAPAATEAPAGEVPAQSTLESTPEPTGLVIESIEVTYFTPDNFYYPVSGRYGSYSIGVSKP